MSENTLIWVKGLQYLFPTLHGHMLRCSSESSSFYAILVARIERERMEGF